MKHRAPKPSPCYRDSIAHPGVFRFVAAILAVVLLSATCSGGQKARLVEVRDAVRAYVGKVVAKNNDICYLMDQFGVMENLPVVQLETFRVVAENFRPSSMGEVRQQLRSEFGSEYEIKNSAHYVVVGRKGQASAHASLFEEIYRQVTTFYNIRGFETSAPEVVMIAIVFRNQDDFKKYCEQDNVVWSKDLRGYYSLKTNRVALFEDSGQLKNATAANAVQESTPPDAIPASRFLAAAMENPDSDFALLLNTVKEGTANTIVHETTHQVGYNIGIHSRIGTTPAWVVEGLATVLESPGMRTRDKFSGSSKVNAERQNWFTGEYESRRQPGDLAKLIASDDMFATQTQDAYSVAWAFTYFMTENPARAGLFARYLKMLTERNSMEQYSPEDRLKDFQSVFGDISRLEVDFLRSMDRLEIP